MLFSSLKNQHPRALTTNCGNPGEAGKSEVGARRCNVGIAPRGVEEAGGWDVDSEHFHSLLHQWAMWPWQCFLMQLFAGFYRWTGIPTGVKKIQVQNCLNFEINVWSEPVASSMTAMGLS